MDDAENRFETETLTGDVRSAILDKFRAQDMTWGMMPEQQQGVFSREIDELAKFVVREAVHLVAADDQPVIRARLGEVKGKKEPGSQIEAKITIAGTSEYRHELFDARGMPIIIVVADHEQYEGERAPEAIDPDQPGLIEDAAA